MKRLIVPALAMALLTTSFSGCDFFRKKKEKEARREEARQRIEELSRKEDDAARVQTEQRIREENARRAEATPGRPKYKPDAAQPAPASTPPAISVQRQKVDNACRTSRCRIVEYRETGNTCYIVIEGPDHNAVSDILDALLRSGMKDFTEHTEKRSARAQGTARVYSAAYTIRW